MLTSATVRFVIPFRFRRSLTHGLFFFSGLVNIKIVSCVIIDIQGDVSLLAAPNGRFMHSRERRPSTALSTRLVYALAHAE